MIQKLIIIRLLTKIPHINQRHTVFFVIHSVNNLPFVCEPPPCGSNMKDTHSENMLHYRFVKNTFGGMSQITIFFLRQCQVSACGIKAGWCIGSSSRCVKLCQ